MGERLPEGNRYPPLLSASSSGYSTLVVHLLRARVDPQFPLLDLEFLPGELLSFFCFFRNGRHFWGFVSSLSFLSRRPPSFLLSRESASASLKGIVMARGNMRDKVSSFKKAIMLSASASASACVQ